MCHSPTDRRLAGYNIGCRVPHAVGRSSCPSQEVFMKLPRSRWSALFAAAWLGWLSMCPTAGHAQDSSSAQWVSWGIMAGGEGVTGAYRGTLAQGLAGGVIAQFPLPSRHLALRADLVYHWVGTMGGDVVTPMGGSSG